MKTVGRESQIATGWFKESNMIVNADTFQATIVKRNSDICNQYTLNIDGNQVNLEKSVKLLGINIDNKLSFDEHISSLCKKASNQLNAISRLHIYLEFKEKEILINSFVYANFNYCPLCINIRLPLTNFKKSIEAHFNTSKIFLLQFYDAYGVKLREKNFGRTAAYLCRTNVFIEFHHFMKKKKKNRHS